MSFQDDYDRASRDRAERLREQTERVDDERRRLNSERDDAVGRIEQLVIGPFLQAVGRNPSAAKKCGEELKEKRGGVIGAIKPQSTKAVGWYWKIPLPNLGQLVIYSTGAWQFFGSNQRTAIIERHPIHGPRWHRRGQNIDDLIAAMSRAAVDFLVRHNV